MRTIYTIFIILIYSISFGQSNYDFNGYLQNMQTVWAPKENINWFFTNSISNRFNFAWYVDNNLTFRASLRNIFDYGQFVSLVPYYPEFATRDDGYFDLTEKLFSDNSYVAYSNIDRINLTYTLENFEIQLGRQRINWGINSVWTPNDIFNSSSFINFDYAEKKGSDALRLQYYFDFASSLELVGKLDNNKNLTFAGKLQFNKWDYDFQVLGGFTDYDFIYAAGWSGNIYGAGFTGELTYFEDRKGLSEQSQIFVSSIGANYTFSNSLFFSAEFLYNSAGADGKLESTINIFDLDYSAKNLSPAKYSIFSLASYPITPLIKSSIASIINPIDGSLFINPATEISLNENVYLLISGQFFIGNSMTEWGDYGQFYYLRIKWNF